MKDVFHCNLGRRWACHALCFWPFATRIPLRSGHYITALNIPGSLLGRSSDWKWMTCDDGRDPRLASARDLEIIAANAYIIGLVKSQRLFEPTSTFA